MCGSPVHGSAVGGLTSTRIDGLIAILVGSGDLSASIGLIGETSHPVQHQPHGISLHSAIQEPTIFGAVAFENKWAITAPARADLRHDVSFVEVRRDAIKEIELQGVGVHHLTKSVFPAQLRIAETTASSVRVFKAGGIDRLIGRGSVGRPSSFTSEQGQAVIDLFSRHPSEYGIDKSCWTAADVAMVAEREGIVEMI